MTARPIIEAPDPSLKRVSAPVERFDGTLQALVDDMFDSMYAASGIGLAAIQIGAPVRVVVVDLQERAKGEAAPEDSAKPPEPARNPQAFVNPELFDPAAELSVYSEGCLSVPDIYAEVERPAAVGLRWQDVTGARHEALLGGLMATCLQHEIDHLEGILFIDHLSRLKRQMALKKLEKARKAA